MNNCFKCLFQKFCLLIIHHFYFCNILFIQLPRFICFLSILIEIITRIPLSSISSWLLPEYLCWYLARYSPLALARKYPSFPFLVFSHTFISQSIPAIFVDTHSRFHIGKFPSRREHGKENTGRNQLIRCDSCSFLFVAISKSYYCKILIITQVGFQVNMFFLKLTTT